MATAEAMTRPHDRHSRRRPFTNWMKRLANLKGSSESTSNEASKTPSSTTTKLKAKKATIARNNPYLVPGKTKDDSSTPGGNGRSSFDSPTSAGSLSYASISQSKRSFPASSDGRQIPTNSNKSAAPTVSTNPETTHSEAAQSKAGTTMTTGGGLGTNGMGGGEGSTFSSPAPSVRSMTTTLTTIQSTATPNITTGTTNQNLQPTAASNQIHSTHFAHQFPTSPPASAIPSHVVGHTSGGHPATYNTATANNLLTDNASILTLASSSKRRRRNSLDTNASVRALAPSSIFGGSRESLPLSVLSGNVGDQTTILGTQHGRPSVGGMANTERASVYSSSGITPTLTSERNSYHAHKQNNPGDGGSVRSGLVSHGRNDSITGSIGGIASTGSPLASPREAPTQGRLSRRSSGWGEVDKDSDEEGDSESVTRAEVREKDR